VSLVVHGSLQFAWHQISLAGEDATAKPPYALSGPLHALKNLWGAGPSRERFLQEMDSFLDEASLLAAHIA